MKPNEDPKMARRNNPLGQRTPSDKVGADPIKHDQSAELVDEIRREADRVQGQNLKNPPSTGKSYDVTGPDRQPGKVAKQSDLGIAKRKPQDGDYTQDNEEEGPRV